MENIGGYGSEYLATHHLEQVADMAKAEIRAMNELGIQRLSWSNEEQKMVYEKIEPKDFYADGQEPCTASATSFQRVTMENYDRARENRDRATVYGIVNPKAQRISGRMLGANEVLDFMVEVAREAMMAERVQHADEMALLRQRYESDLKMAMNRAQPSVILDPKGLT